MIDHDVIACRRMWSSVLIAVIQDYNREWNRSINKDDVLSRARMYFNSRDGREVAALAGVEINIDKLMRRIALPLAEFRDKLIRK